MLCSMALPSKLCLALHRQFDVGSMCDQFGLVSFGGNSISSDSDHGTGPRRYKVNILSNRKKAMLTKDALLSSHLANYLLQIGQFLLDLASLKILLACSILWGCERQIFT